MESSDVEFIFTVSESIISISFYNFLIEIQLYIYHYKSISSITEFRPFKSICSSWGYHRYGQCFLNIMVRYREHHQLK